MLIVFTILSWYIVGLVGSILLLRLDEDITLAILLFLGVAAFFGPITVAIVAASKYGSTVILHQPSVEGRDSKRERPNN